MGRWIVGSTVSALLASGIAICHAACPTEGVEPARIAAVEAGLELRLTDGRLVRLAGVDPAQRTPDAPDLDDTSRAALTALAAGKEARLQLLATVPDRWGRLAAFVFLTGQPAHEGGLATAVIAAGHGRYLAEPSASVCRDTFLENESKAREAKLGLWADPYYSVLAVDDLPAFVERSGTLVLAEGRLTAVQTSPYRTTLHFAAPNGGVSHGGRMLVATILPRTMKAFSARQIDVQRLVGQTLRIRGLLNLRFGPQIELAGPDAAEVIAVAPGSPTPIPHN